MALVPERLACARAALLCAGMVAALGCAAEDRPDAAWIETSGPSPQQEAAPGAPDILLIVVDALRPDHLGCYGYDRPTSPFLDRWSRQATRFDAAYTQGTHTRTSIASLFTGTRPTVHRVRDVDLPADVDDPQGLMTDALAEGLTTLAESLAGAGYETWGFSANPHISPEFGFAQGFARWWQTSAREGDQLLKQFTGKWTERGDDRTRRPLFVYLHFMSVHNPYWAPEEWSDTFEAPAGELVYCNGLIEVSEEDLAYTIARYDSAIRWTDHLLEQVIAVWEASGERPRASVILSDHGEEFQEHGGLGHGMTVHEEAARIALIARSHGLKAGVVAEPVTSLDLHRLLLDEAGAAVPAEAQGRPRATWALPEVHDPVVYTESRTGWAAYRWASRSLLFPRGDPGSAVWYDRASDPREQRPRTDPEVLAELRERLSRALAGDGDLAAALGTPERRPLGDEVSEELRSLGYLGGP